MLLVRDWDRARESVWQLSKHTFLWNSSHSLWAQPYQVWSQTIGFDLISSGDILLG